MEVDSKSGPSPMPSLSKPPRYFPLAHGKYEVAAGLRPLGTDYGNGEADRKVFQFDSEFPRYRRTKELARADRLEKYYPPFADLDEKAYVAVVSFIVNSLTKEWPEYFRLKSENARNILECVLTSERIVFDADFRLISAGAVTGAPTPPYRDLFDALASQVQEDLSIWKRAKRTEETREWLGAIHLCYPNHWAAEDKIGRAFNQVHMPVAGFQKLAKGAPALVDMMIEKGPFVRFAWGVATDRELNHHPANAFQGRQFDAAKPELDLRIERQTLTSFADAEASLFTIRTFFLDCAKDLSPEERNAFDRAIDSMSPESLQYKGMTRTKESIQAWIRSV
jgi:hypothetical protein